ncbi:MAG: hypothetical protein JJU05_09305 [Verrucomicrobia bacterium]|nr:hypothetical protein [Verrucomicrobiota bacterium]
MADFIFFLTIVPMMAIPGIIAIFLGLRLFQEMEEKTVKWLTGVAVAFLALYLSGVSTYILPNNLPKRLFDNIIFFLCTLAAIPLYLITAQKILKHLSYEVPSFTSLLNKNIFILLALQIWMILFNAFEEYAPIKEGYTHIKKEPWGIIGLILPVVAARGFYRFATIKLKKAQLSVPPNPPTSGMVD